VVKGKEGQEFKRFRELKYSYSLFQRIKGFFARIRSKITRRA